MALSTTARSVTGFITGSSGAVFQLFFFARPFTGKSRRELREYIQSKWWNFATFPHYDQVKEWDVYLLSNGLFGHYSLLFLTQHYIEGFLIHLNVDYTSIKTEFHLDTLCLSSLSNKHPNLKALSLGTIACTAEDAITVGHDTLVSMGYYNAVFKNCQDYCKELATALNLANKIPNWREMLFDTVFKGGRLLLSSGAPVTSSRDAVPPTTCSIRALYKHYNTTYTSKRNKCRILRLIISLLLLFLLYFLFYL